MNDALTQALDSADEIQVTVIGRSSGREISLPVWFVRESDRLWLVPVHGSDTSWYRNVLHNPTMRVSVRGAQLTAQATSITESVAVNRVADKFRAKFGADTFEQYYPKHDVAVEIPLPARLA
jgi:deazaflavin-dependent oxidoreductase (nitroreductase family)